MDRDRVASSCNLPPFFDGTNYAAWSEKLQIFLEAHDLIPVDYLTHEWKAPSRIVDGEYVVKPKAELTPDEVNNHGQ